MGPRGERGRGRKRIGAHKFLIPKQGYPGTHRGNLEVPCGNLEVPCGNPETLCENLEVPCGNLEAPMSFTQAYPMVSFKLSAG